MADTRPACRKDGPPAQHGEQDQSREVGATEAHDGAGQQTDDRDCNHHLHETASLQGGPVQRASIAATKARHVNELRNAGTNRKPLQNVRRNHALA